VTGGISEDAISPGKEPSLIVLFIKASAPNPDYFVKGVKLITHKYERYLPASKSLNYMAAVVTIQVMKLNMLQTNWIRKLESKVL
jgi:hypothetical protein